jgi:hypothetical protein
MKFMISLVLIILVVFKLANAQDNRQSPAGNDDILAVQMLIKDDVDRNYFEIVRLASNLTPAQKSFIFMQYEKSGGVPFVLNLLVGLGIGSWVQGDVGGGLLGTIGGLGGFALMQADGSTKQLGALIFLSTYVIDLILPWTYSSRYNSKLRNALSRSDYGSINFAPSFGVTSTNHAFAGLSVSLSF